MSLKLSFYFHSGDDEDGDPDDPDNDQNDHDAIVKTHVVGSLMFCRITFITLITFIVMIMMIMMTTLK